MKFGKFPWSCDSWLKVSPMLKIWALMAHRVMIYWPKCPPNTRREKYPKKRKNWKTVKFIGISIQNYQLVFWISQIYHEILLENACWKSAFLKSRNHILSRKNFLLILILLIIFLIKFNRMIPGFQKNWFSACVF